MTTAAESTKDGAPTESRRARRRRELRARVYDVCRELFRDHGFEATTVEQIAEAADIAPATFFNHFQSKRGVLAAMTSEVMTHVGALIEAHLRSDEPIGDRLVGLAGEAASRIAENHAIARDVVLELVRAEARPEDPSPYLAEVHAPVRAVLADGQRRGEVRTDLDASFLAEMVVGALNAAVTQWLADPHYPIEERLPSAAAFIWDAVRTRSTED